MRFDQAAFGCRLKETRKEWGLTQEQLAAARGTAMRRVRQGHLHQRFLWCQ